MGAEAVKEIEVSEAVEAEGLYLPKSLPQLEKASASNTQSAKIERLLFEPASKRQLRELARVHNILIHHTSIDPLGDFSASPLEILDDRIKLDSLTAVLVSLLKNAHGAPLRALSRSLQQDGEPLLHSIANVSEPTSHSIAGEVSGAEITIGDEEFLLERGVLLDSLADTLLEPGQMGFYLLIAIGDAIVARVLISPPRVGDGRSMVSNFTKHIIPVQIFSLGSTSPETQQFATETGVSTEQVYAIDSTLHLDSFLEQRKPFLLITSDPDCATYIAGRGLVALLADRDTEQRGDQLLVFNSLDLRSSYELFVAAQQLVRIERRRMAVAGGLLLLVLALVLWFFI